MEGEVILKILVVIPYRPADEELAMKAKQIHEIRAGIECEVIAFPDTDGLGWPGVHNKVVKEKEWDYYCYSCADYFPGRNYLKNAIEVLKEYKRGLLAFNDGKWHGKIATAGVITREFYGTVYPDGNLFWPIYKSHYADTELSIIAYFENQLIYDPEIVLIEVDYEKEDKLVDPKDQIIYKIREKEILAKYGKI